MREKPVFSPIEPLWFSGDTQGGPGSFPGEIKKIKWESRQVGEVFEMKGNDELRESIEELKVASFGTGD